jgi:hypothetical protein
MSAPASKLGLRTKDEAEAIILLNAKNESFRRSILIVTIKDSDWAEVFKTGQCLRAIIHAPIHSG